MAIQHPQITKTLRTGYPDGVDYEPEAIGKCAGCNEEIHKGEYFYDLGGELIHHDSICCEKYVKKYATTEIEYE